MIELNREAISALEKSRGRAGLPKTSFDVFALFEDIKRRDFSVHAGREIDLYFVDSSVLTTVVVPPGRRAVSLYVHELLNHMDTPREVMEHVIKHGLVHLDVPPYVADGKLVQHPPEFWERLREIAPQHEAAWAWIAIVLGDDIQVRQRAGRVDVARRWAENWDARRPSLDEMKDLLELAVVKPVI